MNKAEIERALRPFNETYVDHAVAKEVREEIDLIRFDPTGNAVMFIVGGTGAGKSALIKNIRRIIEMDCESELQTDLEKIPTLFAEAVPLRPGSYSDPRLYRHLLRDAQEVGINHKVAIDNLKRPYLYQRRGYDATYGGLSDALINTLQQRRPELVFIDEAQHLTMSNAKRRENHYAEVKSLANLGKVPFVLVGSYALVDFARSDAQLARRGTCFHCRPYSEAEADSFGEVFLTMASNLPISCAKLLNSETIAFVHNWTLGCVGLAHDWLTRAFIRCTKEGARQLERKHLEATRISKMARQTMERELHEGAECFADFERTPELPQNEPERRPHLRPGNTKPKRRDIGPS